MRKQLLAMSYYETYYFANIISNVIDDPWPYIRSLHDWCGEDEIGVLLQPFAKTSCLHSFVQFILRSLIDEEVCDREAHSIASRRRHELWVDRALRYHGFPCDGFRTWMTEHEIKPDDLGEDHIADYHQDLYLTGPLDDLVEHISEEVFFLLFVNRECLAKFNHYVSGVVRGTTPDELDVEMAPFLAAEPP